MYVCMYTHTPICIIYLYIYIYIECIRIYIYTYPCIYTYVYIYGVYGLTFVVSGIQPSTPTHSQSVFQNPDRKARLEASFPGWAPTSDLSL